MNKNGYIIRQEGIKDRQAAEKFDKSFPKKQKLKTETQIF